MRQNVRLFYQMVTDVMAQRVRCAITRSARSADDDLRRQARAGQDHPRAAREDHPARSARGDRARVSARDRRQEGDAFRGRARAELDLDPPARGVRGAARARQALPNNPIPVHPGWSLPFSAFWATVASRDPPGGSLLEPSSAEETVNRSTRSASPCSRSSTTSNSASVGRWRRQVAAMIWPLPSGRAVPASQLARPPWRSRSEASRLPGARRRDTFRPCR